MQYLLFLSEVKHSTVYRDGQIKYLLDIGKVVLKSIVAEANY